MKTGSDHKSKFPVDLHCHTTRSDGSDDPAEFLQNASRAGMKIVAITDHDIRPPKTVTSNGREMPLKEYAASLGMTVIPGIEISCETTVEDCHIVCFGCNWSDRFFDDLEADVVASKIESYRKLVEVLSEHGMEMTWDEVLYNNGAPVDEEHVQKKMIFELMARKGYAVDWSAAKLMVKNTPEFNIKRRKPSPIDVIENVHRVGGVAIMAHPYLVSEPIEGVEDVCSRSEYIDMLITFGLDGIEARYTYGKTSYSGKKTAGCSRTKSRA